MSSPSVNFIGSNYDQSARRKSWMLVGVFSILVTLISAAGAAASYRSVQSGNSVVDEFVRLPVIGDIRSLVFGGPEAPLAIAPGVKRDDNKMNILLLGIGGAGHDGSLLTDSIIFASVDLKEKRVGLVSIPRDTAWKRADGTYEKINSVHAWEEQDHPGEGAVRTAKKFAEAFDTHIDHVVRIDFRGFVAFIDALGGIDINVERGFTDAEYPTEDDLYQTISFKKGQQRMDGATALMYVRSRHGNNGEGGDFARARRQQLVLQAVRERLMSLNTLSDPNKLGNIYSAITRHVQSDLSPWDAFRLAPMIQDFSRDKIASHVITDAPDGELVSTNLNNNYLLFPKGGDWTRIKSLISDPFLTDEELEAKVPSLAKVEVKNGTTRTGLAYDVTNALMLQGFDSMVAGNALKRTYKKTLVFDLTGGKKTVELAKLRNSLDADLALTEATSTKMNDGKVYRAVYAEQLSKEIILNEQTDFLVILGESAYPFVETYATQTQP
ncbi:LCP family protein [Patescibacteria group bacterium]|jgi:LCP family protein required for cell wall assembly|nr:LCP family protein [Patescibacteria group bacterium]